MKILHINSYYSVSKFYKNLYDKQIADGLDVAVYVPIPVGMDVPLAQLGEYTTVSENHNKYDRLFFHVKHRKIVQDIVKKYEINSFDMMHAHSLFSNGYIALRMKQMYGTPYVVAVRSTDVNTFFKYMFHLRKLGVTILNNAEKVIFLSRSYRDFVVEKYVPASLKKEIFDKTEVIPNGIDDFWLENKGGSKAIPKQKELKLVYAGVINKNKNLTTTVKAIEVLRKQGYDVKFTVVGRIDDKDIHQQIIKLPYVKYVNPKPKEELIKTYRANDIFVMPSITETFGLVYAEAMSQGLPVVYSKGQGFDGQFEEGEVGYGVDSLCLGEIADRVSDVINNYEKLSDNCVRLCDKFKWGLIVQEYRSIYKECTNI